MGTKWELSIKSLGKKAPWELRPRPRPIVEALDVDGRLLGVRREDSERHLEVCPDPVLKCSGVPAKFDINFHLKLC